MIVDVLKVQPGENLTEILETTATDEQVSLFNMCHLVSRYCQVLYKDRHIYPTAYHLLTR